jgi:hypothetical protein
MLTARVQERRIFHAGDAVHCAVDPRSVLALRPAST